MPPRSPRTGPSSYLALLRGINVGGNNRIPMQALRDLFTELGHSDVATYIQSGNVVFRSSRDEPSLVAQLEKAIHDRFKFSIRVIIRAAAEVNRLITNPPFPQADPARVLVLFCAAPPAKSLDPARSPGDLVKTDGRHVFLHCPNGLGSTRFTQDYIDRTLATHATGRNWRTVTTLAGMLGPA